MKKSLVMLVVLMSSLALAGSVFAMADWGCYSTPTCKPIPCKDKVLCKGKASGAEKLCGPCAPTIKWSGSWMTIEKCPEVKGEAVKVAKAVKKAKKK